MTILVTGAAGLLGRHVVHALLARGRPVAATYRSSPNGLENERRLAHLDRCDLRDRAAVRELLARTRATTIVHSAARINRDASPHSRLDDNVLATTVLVQEAASAGCRRFVFCSSVSVYAGIAPLPGGFREDQPLAPSGAYAISKLIGEDILRIAATSSFQGCSLRLAGLHGAYRADGVIYRMLSAAERGAPLRIDNPSSRFRLLFLPDAAEAVALAAERDLTGDYRCYNVASRDVFDLPTLAKAVIRAAGSASSVEVVGGQTSTDQVMNIDRICDELGYRPRELPQGLAEAWTWLQSNAVREAI